MKTKQRINITCDSDTWTKFKEWSTKQGSNASAELEKLMAQAIKTEITTEYLSEPKHVQQINEYIVGTINTILPEKIEEYVNKHFSDLHIEPKQTTNTDNTVNTDNEGREDIKPDTDNTGSTATDGNITNYTLSPRTYTDRQVASKEGLSHSAVNRYRTKIRTPKDPTFFDRWHPSDYIAAWHQKIY